MKIFFSLFVVAFCISLHAQEVDNKLQGYFMTQSEESLYSYFAFDGNGKVDISDYGKGDYFVKGDSVVVFPDKSIFIFELSENQLKGKSDWVKNTNWKLNKDSLAENNRKDGPLAQKNAELLYEYYTKTRSKKENDLERLFNEDLMNQYSLTITDLCNRGLAKACLEEFGLKLVGVSGGIGAVLTQENIQLKYDPELIKLAQKIIEMGEPEGHTALGSYYYSLGDKNKASNEWQKAIEKGSTKAALIQFAAEIEEE